MRHITIVLFAAGALSAQQPARQPETLRGLLLEQLHTTHDRQDWFVPISGAVEGLTPEQAKWTDGNGGHSIGQLVNHLAFWNERALAQFEGRKPAAFSGNNDETFNSFDGRLWADAVARLERVMKEWERAVERADDAKLRAAASQVMHVGTHNAYHVGQILYVRKLQGSWNPAKGVK